MRARAKVFRQRQRSTQIRRTRLCIDASSLVRRHQNVSTGTQRLESQSQSPAAPRLTSIQRHRARRFIPARRFEIQKAAGLSARLYINDTAERAAAIQIRRGAVEDLRTLNT